MLISYAPPPSRQREAEALRAKLAKQLEAGWQQAVDSVEDACAELAEAHARFDREQLRTFDQGGKYALQSVQVHRCGPGSVCRPAAAWPAWHTHL